jgi:hypothetical protein
MPGVCTCDGLIHFSVNMRVPNTARSDQLLFLLSMHAYNSEMY